MIKHLRIYILAVAVAATAVAALGASVAPTQQHRSLNRPPDMEQIKADVTNPSSRYYYPKLMEQYQRNDTVMDLDDYRYLYLGMAFQEDYNPYRHSSYDSKIKELYYRDNHTRAELDSIISYAGRALADNPFDIEQINYLIYALRNRGKVHLAAIWQYRLNHLLEAILSTGTGADADNAWVVIDPKHEYDIINLLKTTVVNHEYERPYYDHMYVEQRDDSSPDSYYFNVRYVLEEYYRKHPEQLEREE